MEFSKNGQVDPEIILEVITSKSLTKMKRDVRSAIRKKIEENNGVQQMQQQLQQADQQMKEMQKELQKTQQQLQKFNQEKMALEKAKMENDKELGWFKAKNTKEFNDRKIENDNKRIEAEVLELYDSNPRNDEIKNN